MKTTKITKTKKKVFPKAHFTDIPKWFEEMYYQTKGCCPTAVRHPSILAYRAFLWGQRSVASPN